MIRFFFAISKQKSHKNLAKPGSQPTPNKNPSLSINALNFFISLVNKSQRCAWPFPHQKYQKKLVKHIYAEGLWRQVVCSFAKGGYVSISLMPSCIHEHNVNIFPALALEHGLPMYVKTST